MRGIRPEEQEAHCLLEIQKKQDLKAQPERDKKEEEEKERLRKEQLQREKNRRRPRDPPNSEVERALPNHDYTQVSIL